MLRYSSRSLQPTVAKSFTWAHGPACRFHASLDDVDRPHDGALLWMDIEGYEGVTAGVVRQTCWPQASPLSANSTPATFENSGGMNWFREALAGPAFDLKQGEKAVEITLDQLAVMYPAGYNLQMSWH
ncbi:MAG: hypothetical protein U1E74_01220 [Paenacidovorax caeni]